MSAPLYRKVDPRVWDDDKFIELSDDAQLLWLCILTGPQTSYVPGLMTTGVGTLSEVLRKPFERVQEAFEELLEKGLIEHDPRRRVLRVPNAPRFNPPDNPNVLKGWFRVWESAPESPLKYAHIDSLEAAIDRSREKLAEAWDETFGTVPETLRKGFSEPFPEPFGIQKQKQKQKQDQKIYPPTPPQGEGEPEEPEPLELVPPEVDPDRLTPERLVALWNEATGGRIRDIEPPRRKALREAVKRQPDPAFWRRCFEKAGLIKNKTEAAWLSLDWILVRHKSGWNYERVEAGVLDFRLSQGSGRDIRSGYVPYGPDDNEKWEKEPSGDITHMF